MSTDELRLLAQGAELSGPAWAATPSFLDAFGLTPADDEDAERTVLYVAALVALLQHGRRLVVVADTAAHGGGDGFGGVLVDRIGFQQVSALFAEDPASLVQADAVVRALAGLALEDAWDHPAHEALLRDTDLLWYGPEEWKVLTGDE